MTINERYRVFSWHRSRRYRKVYIIMFLLLFSFSFTLAKYMSQAQVQTRANVANWNITINDEPIHENTFLQNTIVLQYDEELQNNIIQPGQTGYFDIVLDPSETEVSIEYEIGIDLSNMPEGIELTGCILNSTEEVTIEENKIVGELRLTNNNALDISDKKNYRIFWKWAGSYNIEDEQEYCVNTNIRVKQIIE